MFYCFAIFQMKTESYSLLQLRRSIETFNSDGVGSVFASGLNGPLFLAFTNDAGVPLPLANQVRPAQVPEPSTWALFALSLLALLGTARRRGRGA